MAAPPQTLRRLNVKNKFFLKKVIGFMFFLRNIKCKTKQRANNEKGWESSLKNYIYLSNVVLQ